MSKYKRIAVDKNGSIDIVRLVDAQLFDHVHLNELQDELAAFVEEAEPEKVIFDFSVVEFCSTSLINTLLKVKRGLAKDGGRVRLCGMRESVREAFKMLNLDGTVFDIDDTIDEAKAAL